LSFSELPVTGGAAKGVLAKGLTPIPDCWPVVAAGA